MKVDKNLNTPRNKFIGEYLKENYSKKSMKDIMNDLGLSYNYMVRMSKLFNLKRGFNDSPRSLIKLLDLTNNISCYWLGFLLADGHISKSMNIQVNLNKKDQLFFEKIENHLNIKLKPSYVEKLNSVRFSLCDKQTIIQISKIFKWESNKTKNIPIIPKLEYDQLFSLIIGFIDGDGTISKSGGFLRIKCDPSWKEILEDFYEVLTNERKIFKLSSDKCSSIFISKVKVIQNIKKKSESLNLPIMNRKWDRVDNNRIIKCDKKIIVLELLECGKSIKDIITETKYSRSFVYKIKYQKFTD